MGRFKRRASRHMDLRDVRQGQKQGIGEERMEGVSSAHIQRGAAEEMWEKTAAVLRRKPRYQNQYYRVDGVLGSDAGLSRDYQ